MFNLFHPSHWPNFWCLQLFDPINWQLEVYSMRIHSRPKNQKRFQRIHAKYLRLRGLRLGRAGGYFVACATASKWIAEASSAISSRREKNRVEAEKRLTDLINIPLMSLRKRRVPAKSLHKQLQQTELGGHHLIKWFFKLEWLKQQEHFIRVFIRVNTKH